MNADRGSTTAVDAMRAAEGPDRDRAMRAWCGSVWTAIADNRETVADLLRQHGIV